MKHLIIGGTGTLGRAVVSQLTREHPSHEIIVFSRGELEQQRMRVQYPHLKYVIGDIRDYAAVCEAMRGVNVAYHFAALKHVDVVEANPLEAVKTNIDGTRNIAEAAVDCGVENLVFSSTDKAVLPINIYGMTKAIAEKYLLSRETSTNFSVYRWGNVVGSRGSAIPIFVNQLLSGRPVTLTDERMTRFWIRIETAAKYLLETFHDRQLKGVRIPEMKAAKVTRVIDAIGAILGVDPQYEITGIRPGEKVHECLYTSHEHCLNSNTAPQYSDEELKALLAPTVQEIVNAR